MARALIALGSNLGERAATLDAAVAALGRLPNSQLLAASSWLESVPVGGPSRQPDYLNGAVLLETALAPFDLLDHMQRIETAHGRVRTVHWGPRTLDLDLLLYDNQVIDSERLCVPHPRMTSRRFVLAPAAEIAPNMVHPATGRTVAELLSALDAASP